jgi:hypothetical protein
MLFIFMDILNINYDQDDIHLNMRDAYNLIHEEIQSTYKGTLNPYHLKRMYMSVKKRMIWYLTFLYPTKPWKMFFKSWMQL